ncbi:MAG TPA: hypothetical protein VJ725_21360 [Thermoanaerobaculia bacterium]|nr:hypothetical protein [Thermoanaerobaculia bacterium]
MIITKATTGVITGNLGGSPNRLLFTDFSPETAACRLDHGRQAALSVTVLTSAVPEPGGHLEVAQRATFEARHFSAG